jgi:predicted SprT family Zn-dependent metalloprotease
MPVVQVYFDTGGQHAGWFRPKGSKGNKYGIPYVDLNTTLCAENFEQFLIDTIPHETAHYVDYARNGNKQRRLANGNCDHHGRFWKQACSDLGFPGLKRCHNFDVASVKRNYTIFDWRCGCQTHPIKTVMNRNMLAKVKIYGRSGKVCKKCGVRLTQGKYETKPLTIKRIS